VTILRLIHPEDSTGLIGDPVRIYGWPNYPLLRDVRDIAEMIPSSRVVGHESFETGTIRLKAEASNFAKKNAQRRVED
jgi:hypothetical protein